MNVSSSTEIAGLYHCQRPLFFSHEFTYEQQEPSSFSLTLYLDVDDKQNRLRGLFYQGQGAEAAKYFPGLAKQAQAWEGKRLWDNQHELDPLDQADEGDLIQWQKFSDPAAVLDLPLLLSAWAIQEYRGQVLNLSEARQTQNDKLICRCFGVYENEIKDFIQQQWKAQHWPQLQELTAGLKAGGGCTSCLAQILPMIARHIQTLPKEAGLWDQQGKYRRFLGMTPAQLVLALDRQLKAWPHFQVLQPVITELKGLELELGLTQAEHGPLQAKQLAILKAELIEWLQLRLRLPLIVRFRAVVTGPLQLP